MVNLKFFFSISCVDNKIDVDYYLNLNMKNEENKSEMVCTFIFKIYSIINFFVIFYLLYYLALKSFWYIDFFNI